MTVDSRIHELAADDSGSFQDQELTGASVAFGSGLTCKQDSRSLVTVFYIDRTQSIHFIGYLPGLPGDTWEESIKDTDPAPGSALTCFTKKASNDTRVYYLDREGQINEVTWKDSNNEMHNNPLTYKAKPGSALTCFGVGGELTRLYYLDEYARVTELAYGDGHWSFPSTLSDTAAPDTALTCYGANGTATRLYYLDTDYRVNELARDGQKFVNTLLLAGT